MPAVIARAAFDCPDVQTLRRQLSAHYLETYGASDLDGDRPQDFDPPAGGCLVAYIGGEPVGTLAWRRVDETTVDVLRLYVTPNHRGAGVARALADAVQADLAAAGYRVFRALTDSPHVAALAHQMTAVTPTPHGDALVCALNPDPRKAASMNEATAIATATLTRARKKAKTA